MISSGNSGNEKGGDDQEKEDTNRGITTKEEGVNSVSSPFTSISISCYYHQTQEQRHGKVKGKEEMKEADAMGTYFPFLLTVHSCPFSLLSVPSQYYF